MQTAWHASVIVWLNVKLGKMEMELWMQDKVTIKVVSRD